MRKGDLDIVNKLQTLIDAGSGGGAPSGAAAGDLSGTYPNPTVAKLNGVAAASYPTLTGSQTLTNKTIDAANNTLLNLSATSVKDGTDTTKVLNFDVSAFSTATTRTLTPAAGGNSVTVRADAGASNNYLTGITTAGVITKAQPAIANLSDAGQLSSWAAIATTTKAASGANSDITSLTGLTTTVNTSLLGYQAMGSPIKGQSLGVDLRMVSISQNLFDGRAIFHAIHVPVACTITGAYWPQITAGNYTADNYNGVGLYSYSSGTLTLRASSTDDGTIWKATSGTTGKKDFSSTYVAAAGLYFICFLWNNSASVTTPAIGAGAGIGTVVNSLDFTNSVAAAMYVDSKTALPSPTQATSGLTAGGYFMWTGVY